MIEGPFYVQCAQGYPDHLMEAKPDSELETKCRQRAEAGYLDALALGPNDCPGCVEERREAVYAFNRNISMFGCPYEDSNGNCEENCLCMNRPEIADSPYDLQVLGIAYSA